MTALRRAVPDRPSCSMHQRQLLHSLRGLLLEWVYGVQRVQCVQCAFLVGVCLPCWGDPSCPCCSLTTHPSPSRTSRAIESIVRKAISLTSLPLSTFSPCTHLTACTDTDTDTDMTSTPPLSAYSYPNSPSELPLFCPSRAPLPSPCAPSFPLCARCTEVHWLLMLIS
jgi:hypothetical protein